MLEKCKYKMVFEKIYTYDEKFRLITDLNNYEKVNNKNTGKFLKGVMDFSFETGFVTSAQYNKLLEIYETLCDIS